MKIAINPQEFSRIVYLATNGCCAAFALELSKSKGYKIVGFSDATNNVCHFCCLSDEGYIDAKGKGLTWEIVSQDYVHVGGLQAEYFTQEDLEEILVNNASLGALDPPGYREALRQLFEDPIWEAWTEVGRDYLSRHEFY